ncbi:MAG: hypothetical protein ACREVG_14400 [Burkholderiales bacterium]
MIRQASRALLFALLVTLAASAPAADPVLMLLLSVAREIIFSAARERLTAPSAPEPAPAVTVYPGTVVEPAQVRRLIDEGFSYLTGAQREEVYESLHASLIDPKNAAVRASMIEYFAERAIAMRAAQDRLANLSQPEKSRLAMEFRKQVAELPAEEAAQLAELLRRQVLPVPRDLNDMLLAELDAR